MERGNVEYGSERERESERDERDEKMWSFEGYLYRVKIV